MDDDFDLAVVGGGPAGAVAAWLAARDGQKVALIDPGRTPFRLEGLSPRLQGWLQRRGLFDAGALRAMRVPRISHWNGTGFAGNAELIVDRAAMDGHLRRQAVAAGACWIADTGRSAAGGVELASGRRLAARLVFDARGRRGLHERQGIRRGPATIAIGSAVALSASEPPATFLVPIDAGWIWLAHPGGGRAWVQVTLDAADPAGRAPPERLAAALESAAASLPGGCALRGRPLVREAAPVLPGPLDSLEVIPLGDALAAMDPLSGHGMFWAVSGALAATAVRRFLREAPDQDAARLALRFLNDRQTDVYHRQARLGRDFIRAEQGRGNLPFWRARAAFPDDLPLDPAGGGIEIATRVVVEDNVLREREVLMTPETPAGVCWLGDRPAVDLYRAWAAGMRGEALARSFGAAGRGFESWLATQKILPEAPEMSRM